MVNIMARDVSPAFVKQFESEVKQAYQEQGEKLANAVRTKMGVVGEAVVFPTFGKSAMKVRGATDSQVVFGSTGAASVSAPLLNYYDAQLSSEFDEAALNFDDRQELAKAIGYGMRRGEDTIIINALAKSVGATIASGKEGEQVVTAIATNADKIVGDGTALLTVDMIMDAGFMLDSKGVPATDRYFVMSASAKRALLASEKVSSIDYNNVKALVNGQIDEFLGFKFIMIADEEVGGAKTGLPLNGTKRISFAFHKDAVGYGNGIDKRVDATWNPNYLAYQISSLMKAGAVAIDPEGIVGIMHKER